MKNFVQSGTNLTVESPAPVVSGQGVVIGSIFGVAAGNASTGEALDLVTEGVFTLPAKAGDTFAVGDKAYWNVGTGVVTVTASGNTKIGYVVANDNQRVNVRLIPSV